MSISHANLIKFFCLESMLLDHVNIQDQTIDLHVRSPRTCLICPQCGHTTRRVHRRSQRTVKHMMHDDKIVQLRLTVRNWYCRPCGQYIRESFPGIDRRRTTAHFRTHLLPKARDRSFRAVGNDHGISGHTVQRAAVHAIQTIPVQWPHRPFILGIDQHSFAGRDMVTTITDVTHHRLLTLVPNDRKVHIERYLQNMPVVTAQQIMAVCMDMSTLNRSVIEHVLPKVPIIVDKFHVIQYLNWHLTELRRLYTSSAYPLPKRLFETNKEDLTNDDWNTLQEIFRRYPPLAEFWHMKEALRNIYRLRDAQDAKQRFHLFMQGLEHDPRPRWQAVYGTFSRWEEYITNYFDFRITNAYTEGVHTRIKLLKRISYGFRNKTNYIAKMMLAFLPLSIIDQAMETSPCLT